MLLKNGKTVELLVNYEPNLTYISEWWKQLYGESEGKDGKGIYPSSAQFTTDLHSMGQYVQGGQRFLFETVLNITKTENDIEIIMGNIRTKMRLAAGVLISVMLLMPVAAFADNQDGYDAYKSGDYQREGKINVGSYSRDGSLFCCF